MRSQTVDAVGRWRAPLGILAGLFAGQWTLLTRPEGGIGPALEAGARVALGSWALLTFLVVADAMLRAASQTDGGRLQEEGGLAAAGGPGPLPVIGVACLLIGFATYRSSGRLAVTLLCFLALATALAWTVQRSAGRRAAGRVAAALSVVAVVGSCADIRTQPSIVEAQAGSPYRWPVGWPTEAWVLRHEIRPRPPLPARPIVLNVPLAARYSGPARVYSRLNGHELGAARLGEGASSLHVDVPGELVAAQGRLVFELRQAPVDPRLRVTAHRWGQAATAGRDASSYFDAERWWPGTFQDAIGRPQAGIYVVQVEPAG